MFFSSPSIQLSGQTNLQSLQAMQFFCKNLGLWKERQEPVLLFFEEAGFPNNGPNIFITDKFL